MLYMYGLSLQGLHHQHKLIEALLSEEVVADKIITESNINVEDIIF